MPEKDDAQHGHEIIAGRQLGVGAKLVGRFPQVGFEFFDIVEHAAVHDANHPREPTGHAASQPPCIVPCGVGLAADSGGQTRRPSEQVVSQQTAG